MVFCGDALVVEAEGDDGLFADASCVHSCDDFLSEVAAFGEVDSGVHDARFGGDGVWSEVDVVHGVPGFDSRGVDGEPAGGFGLLVFGGIDEVVVEGFELVGWDGDVEADLSGEVEAVDVDFDGLIGKVDCCCGVGVFFDGVDVEEFEGGGAVD